ncbi:hypothetical protein L227DRAFT_657017 [Lentinus tigrinus ALCF2SS1-6]|uniref:Uncharacterized protein n=1 Tax=Lentinus tigrinus ALCF2SS1-6 TaxID=1328759 RepID=A0A5C2RVL2_9APHY|nr:hypothetical protein L227DRAFT_657017 [Lentinus tigrinus ALCF2SS1-6]
MASSTVRAFNDHDQLATPPPDDDDLVASTIVQASLQSERTIGDAPQATQGTDPPPALDTHPESSTGSPSEDSTPPFARQFVVPQSLYRPVPSIDWMDSFGFTIGRITFNLRKRVRDKQGVPMSLLLNDRDEVVAKALQGANDEVLSDLVRRGMRRMILRIAWPAYPDYCFERDMAIVREESSSQTTGTISRVTLARDIADAFASFVRLSRMLPLSDDPWEAGFRFGPGALNYSHLWLVSLWQVGGNVFEAEVRHTAIV